MGNQAKPCEATGTFWVMRCYVQSLAIYPVAAHRSTDYEQPGAMAATVQAPPTVAPASRKLASGFMLACAVAKRGGLEGTAVAGAIKP